MPETIREIMIEYEDEYKLEIKELGSPLRGDLTPNRLGEQRYSIEEVNRMIYDACQKTLDKSKGKHFDMDLQCSLCLSNSSEVMMMAGVFNNNKMFICIDCIKEYMNDKK